MFTNTFYKYIILCKHIKTCMQKMKWTLINWISLDKQDIKSEKKKKSRAKEILSAGITLQIYHNDLCVIVRFGIVKKFLLRYPSFGIKCQANFKNLKWLFAKTKQKQSHFLHGRMKFILVYRKWNKTIPK